MVAELQKNTPPADQPPAKPDAAEKPATTAASTDQTSAIHDDSHGSDALNATRQFRLLAEKNNTALPGMDVHQDLKPDGSAQPYHVEKGDTLSDIARRQLGPNASIHDVYNQVNEIAKANHIADANKIRAGMDLQLPEFHPHQHRHHHKPQPDQPGTTPGDGPKTPGHPGDPPPKSPEQPRDGNHNPPHHDGDKTPPKPPDAGPKPPEHGPKPPEHGPKPPEAGPHPPGHGPDQPAAPAKPADTKSTANTGVAVEALEKALGEDNPVPPPSMGEYPAMPMGPITDKRKIMDVLGDKSPEEIKAISDAFNAKYGKEHGNRNLEDVIESRLSGTDKSKVTDIFHRKDKADDAGRVHTAMQEMHQWIEGRSKTNCEKDIRDTLSTMNSTQLAAFKQDYESRYHTKFDDDIAKDTKMSADTKAALAIYEKGSDHRTPQDTVALADIATKAKNLDMFQEAFRGASPEARKQYMDNGGDAKMKKAFSGYFSDSDLDKARDYVKEGHLDVTTKVKDNTGIFSSNDKAIDTSISAMTKEEKEQYVRGKTVGATFPEYVQSGEDSVFNKAAYDKLKPDQKADYDKYRALHDAMETAGNPVKVARWEDMIANNGETLVTKLAQHGGMWSDKIDKTLTDIEGMNKGDFDRLKHDPNYRKQVDAALAMNYSGDDLKRAEKLLDTKLAHDKFEDGGQNDGTRSIVQQIKDKDSWFNADTKGMLNAVENMTPADQKKYREDANFKKEVDKEVKSALLGTQEYESATRALERVSKGQSPNEDVIDKLNSHLYGSHDKATMIGEIEDSFKQNPAMRERIAHPMTDQDKALAKDFETKARECFGDDAYKKLVEPLVTTGYVPFAEKAQLYKGFWSNDTKQVYDAIATASPDDQKAIAADPQKTLAFLTPEQQQLAANIAKQGGQMKPEDTMRAAILGESGDKDTIKDLGSLKPEERAQLVQAYEAKYKTNLMADLDDKLSGQARIEAERNFRELPETAREAYNNARDEESKSNDGLGRAFVRNTWDGTSDMSRDDVNQMAAQMEDYSKVYKDMPVADAQKMAGDLTDAVDLYRKSKGAAADAVVDGTIIVAGVGGAAFTGGVSLGLIATTGLAGAVFKVGTKAAIEGADYDTSQIAADGATGAIDAATMVIGPGEVAKILKIGGKAATMAGDMAITEAGNLAAVTGRQVFKEGAEATLSKELTRDVSTALAHGAKEIDQKTLQGLAEKYAARPEDVQTVKEILTNNLNKAITTESSNALKTTLREVALNSGAGAGAGGGSAMVRGLSQWDSGKSVNENLTNIAEQTAMGCGSGMIMGGGATVGFKALGRGFSAAREALADHVNVVSKLGEGAEHTEIAAGEHVALNKAGQVAEIKNVSGSVTKVEYHGTGPMEGKPSLVKLPDGRSFENVGENRIRISSPENPKGVTVDGDVKVNNKGEVQVTYGNSDKQTFHPDGTSTLQKPTGDVVAHTNDGKVLAVKSRSGNTSEFSYLADGKMEGVQYKNGRSVISEDGGKTYMIKESATADPVKFNGEVTADRSGVVHLKPADGGPERILRPDGSSSHMDPVVHKPTDITYPDGKGKTFEYNADGSVKKYSNETGYTYQKFDDGFHSVNLDGTDGGKVYSSYSVAADGSFVKEHNGMLVETATDGRTVLRDKSTGVIKSEKAPEGYSRDGLSDGADGRPLAASEKQRTYARENFGKPEDGAHGDITKAVETELKDVKAIGPDGQPTSAYDSLMKDPTLSDAQKNNILQNLGNVREHYAQYRVGDRMHPDPEVNWIHTQGEMAKVLEVGRAKNLSPTELEDSLLASMYSDAVKFANPAPEGVSANFFTHHLDGALAAEQALKKQGYPAERVDRIVEAIKAHQIAPPKLMGELYYGQISRTLDADIAAKKISAEEGAHLKDVLKGMSETGPDGKTRIKWMADVNNAPKQVNADGSMEVAFTDDQRKVLGYAGIDKWSTPYDPKLDPNFNQLSKAEQADAIARHNIAQTLIDGDGIDNYATTGGASKIVAIRGPGTYFKDGQVWDSIKSVDASFDDGYSVMSPEARKIADGNLAIRKEMTDAQASRIKTEMDQWLRDQGHDPSKPIPYYNTDLKYPTSTTPVAGEKNLPGLNDQEMKDYLFAKDIRQKMTDLLRSDHRVEGDLPGEFTPKGAKYQWDAERKFGDTSADPISIPGVRPEDIKPGQTFTSPDKTLSAFRNPEDGSLAVTDFKNNTFHRYDSNNHLVESTVSNNSREFKYGTDGKVTEVVTTDSLTGEKTTLSSPYGEDYKMTKVDRDGKTISEATFEKPKVVVDADGTVNVYKKDAWDNDIDHRMNADGSVDDVKVTGRIEYMEASLPQEKQGLENVLSKDLAGDPKRLARFQELIQQFENQAGTPERSLNENQKALLYKQINRLLADSPTAAIPMADRISLAEQILNHSANPSSVDQGLNGTCNVTTLEHRNYWRNPDRNAQVIADIALNGKYQFANGRTAELADVAGEIKPDFEAKRGLAVQNNLENGRIKDDGARDYSSQLLETAMANQKYINHSEVINADGKIVMWADYQMRYDIKGKPLGIVDHEHMTMLFDKDGVQARDYDPKAQYYTFDKKPLTVPPERLVYDKNGMAQGFVDNKSNLKMAYDSQGRPIEGSALGDEGDQIFDDKGNLLMLHTKKGDMHYEKVPTGPDKDGERVMVDINGKTVTLMRIDGRTVTDPQLGGSDLLDISKQVTGFNEKPFVIADKSMTSGFRSTMSIDSEDALIKQIEELDKDHNLPGVLVVNSSRPPFDQSPVYGPDGRFEGYHVINVHGIEHVKDPLTGEDKIMIRYTNQWGSAADRLEHGIDAKELYGAMKAEPDKVETPPPLPAKVVDGMWSRFKKWWGSK